MAGTGARQSPSPPGTRDRSSNLSVTGVLLQTERLYEIGERVEVEIDFLTKPESKTVVTGVGHVVREHRGEPPVAAIHFDLGCTPKPELSDAYAATVAPAAHAARP